MNPLKRNKVDISSLSEEEQKLFRLYGKLPTHKNVLNKMQKDRKYFDSGDYALSKAGKAPQTQVGTAIPNPENIPHASSPNPLAPSIPVTSPVKDSPLSEAQHEGDLAPEGDNKPNEDSANEEKQESSEAMATSDAIADPSEA